MTDQLSSPVSLTAADAPNQPAPTPELEELYRGFEKELLVPLWTEIGDLMPVHPRSRAVPHLWQWRTLLELADRAGHLVPVGRGGERRAIALANPALGGKPYATPTLWAAIQYLMPGEDAPEHRHTQNAFRFVVEGSGVWTVVGRDPVPMNRGDFLPQAGWNWHAHHNATDKPMAWIDGLDIPFQYTNESQFFEFGRDTISPEERTTPERSRSQRLWGHPGLRPVSSLGATPGTPLLNYRWVDTDAALRDQLELEDEGFDGTLEPGHAAVRYSNPTNGGDVLPTVRAETHRIRSGSETAPRREVGSSVFQVFDGSGTVTVGETTWSVTRGDMFVVPSWQPLSVRSEASGSDSDSGHLDLFRFSDSPIFEALHLDRASVDPSDAPGEPPMKLATIRTLTGETHAVRVDDDRLVDLGARDLGAFLGAGDWAERAAGASESMAETRGAVFAPVIPRPGKVVCVGLNYRNHILEMGRDLPEYPTLFSKYADALIGANDEIVLPPETAEFDWECELAVVIGSAVRRARGADAEAAIAGFAVLNDVTCRDWQFRTKEWLQGKTWEATTPLGPYLVTPDELPGGVRPGLDISTTIDGETVQHDNTADLLFDPVALVEYISTIITLRPGDVIATGTPGGVGHARKPSRYLRAGQRLTTEVAGLGRCENMVVADTGA